MNNIDKNHRLLLLLSFAAAVLPLFIKRAIFIGEYSYHDFLIADYAARLLIIVSVFYAFHDGIIRSDGKKASLIRSVPIFMIACIAVATTQVIGLPALHDAMAANNLINPIFDIDVYLALFDLTFGIALVALSEELAFRKYLFGFFERLGIGPVGVIVASSTLFALLHFTDGYPNLISTFVHGLILGSMFALTRRLSLCIVAHYLIDFCVSGSWYGEMFFPGQPAT